MKDSTSDSSDSDLGKFWTQTEKYENENISENDHLSLTLYLCKLITSKNSAISWRKLMVYTTGCNDLEFEVNNQLL